jgi:hypothetical protein
MDTNGIPKTDDEIQTETVPEPAADRVTYLKTWRYTIRLHRKSVDSQGFASRGSSDLLCVAAVGSWRGLLPRLRRAC